MAHPPMAFSDFRAEGIEMVKWPGPLPPTNSFAAPPLHGPQAYFHAFVPPATPTALGAIRLWICLILFSLALLRVLRATAWLPREILRGH